jgi:two-component system response regulator FixJ
LDLKPTVFVVDDDQAVRDSLRWLLESVSLPVETFASAGEFLDRYNPEQPGCLVVDVRLPGLSGLELQERLKQQKVDLPAIVITGHGDVAMAVEAMKAGALEFFEKPVGDQKLLDSVWKAIERNLDDRRQRAAHNNIRDRLNRLTPREREVMDLVVMGKLNKQIAAELGVSFKTVEVHRARVMQKMEAASLAELVRMHAELQAGATPAA